MCISYVVTLKFRSIRGRTVLYCVLIRFHRKGNLSVCLPTPARPPGPVAALDWDREFGSLHGMCDSHVSSGLALGLHLRSHGD